MAPISLDDPRYGMIEVKAFGTYGFQVADPIKFHEKLVATDDHYTTEELKKNMMGAMGGYIMSVMGELELTYDTFAKKNQETSEKVLNLLKKKYEPYGLNMLEFNIMGMNLTDQFKK
jgi:membrane protease subunit (stomatin/prohibitin family)